MCIKYCVTSAPDVCAVCLHLWLRPETIRRTTVDVLIMETQNMSFRAGYVDVTPKLSNI